MKLTAKKYAQALAQVLSEKDVDPKTVAKHFIEVLIRRRQTKLLSSILKLVEEEWCRAQGVTRIEVEFSPKFKDALESLEKALKATNKFLIKSKPRDDLIGGYRIKIEDTMIDASLLGRLTALSHNMKK